MERLATEQEVNRLERMRELSTAVNLSFSFRTPSISCLSAAIPRTTINRRNEDWMLIEIDWCVNRSSRHMKEKKDKKEKAAGGS